MQASNKTIFTRLTFRQPPLPAISAAAKKLQEQNHTSVEKVLNILSRDSISAMLVLKRANNAYYGLQGNINSLTHAIEILGPSSVLRMLTLDQGFPSENIPLNRLMQHGFTTAQISHRLVNDQWLWAEGSQTRAGGVFTAGLIHNLGRQAICLTYPEESAILYGFSDMTFPVTGTLRELEQLQFGADCLEIGAFIGTKYRLPSGLIDILRYHEYYGTPDPTEESYELVMTINAAAEMATSLGYGIDAQGSFLQPDSSPGLNWFGKRFPGKIEQVLDESHRFLVPHDLVKAGIMTNHSSTRKVHPSQPHVDRGAVQSANRSQGPIRIQSPSN